MIDDFLYLKFFISSLTCHAMIYIHVSITSIVIIKEHFLWKEQTFVTATYSTFYKFISFIFSFELENPTMQNMTFVFFIYYRFWQYFNLF